MAHEFIGRSPDQDRSIYASVYQNRKGTFTVMFWYSDEGAGSSGRSYPTEDDAITNMKKMFDWLGYTIEQID